MSKMYQLKFQDKPKRHRKFLMQWSSGGALRFNERIHLLRTVYLHMDDIFLREGNIEMFVRVRSCHSVSD